MIDTSMATNAVTLDGSAQDFWLTHLNEASRFNKWVLSKFAHRLGPTVLEVGCGTGNFTTLMAGQGHEILGIDIDPCYVEVAERRLAGMAGARVRCGDATTLEIDEVFDTVVLLDVLEHIADDRGFLERLRRRLRPGGWLVMKVPAGQWLYSPMDEAIGHHRRYTRQSLTEIIEAAGFATPEQQHFNMFGMPGWWLNGRLLKRTQPPGEQVRLFEALVPAFQAIEKVLPPPVGLSLIACAQSL